MTSPKNAEDTALPASALTVDARGMRCPWPVLRAARAMRSHDSIVLISDDPVARRDVPEMAQLRGWQCDLSDNDQGTRFFLRRRQKQG